MKTIYMVLGFLLILQSCKSVKATPQEIAALNTLVTQKEFKIESDWAYPQTTNALQQVLNSGLLPPGSTTGAINLIGNSNFLTISKDSVSSYLPYFGERQMQVDYPGGNSAIQLKGTMENYKVTQNKNNSTTISFQAKSKSEQFDVYITLFPNSKSDMIINSNSRFPIRYSGTVKPVKD